MKEVAISEFKAKCVALLEQVSKTRQPIRVTRFEKPIAEVGRMPKGFILPSEAIYVRSVPQD